MSGFAKWLESELDRREWRQSDLAHRAGLTNATISRVLNGSRRAGPDVCIALADALDMPPEHLFRLAGLLPPIPNAVQDEQEALGLFRKLDEGMRPVALGILRTLGGAQKRGRNPQAESGASQYTLSERLARDLVRDIETMRPEDQQRVFDLMKRLRGGKAGLRP